MPKEFYVTWTEVHHRIGSIRAGSEEEAREKWKDWAWAQDLTGLGLEVETVEDIVTEERSYSEPEIFGHQIDPSF